jgi:hypothetical protein
MSRRDIIVKIADFLDRHDMEEEADFMDSLLENEEANESVEIEIPEAELDEIQKVLEALKDSLQA